LRRRQGEHRGHRAAHAQPQLRAVGGAPCAQLPPTCCQRAHGKLLGDDAVSSPPSILAALMLRSIAVSGPGGRTLPDISSSGPPLLPICTGAKKSEGTRALCRTMSKSLRLGLALGNPNHLADGPLDRATSDCLLNGSFLDSLPHEVKL